MTMASAPTGHANQSPRRRRQAPRPPSRPAHRLRRFLSRCSRLSPASAPRRLTYYDLSQMAASGATLAIAAIGQTIVILSGGFDLSAGAAISLVNVALASSLQDPSLSPLVIVAAGVGIGMASGAFNGFFVAILGMQPIVVTLSTMFILQGVTLLVMDKPGGQVSPALGDLLLGDAIPNVLPRPVLLIVLVLAAWTWVQADPLRRRDLCCRQRCRCGARGRRPHALMQFMVYVIGGGCYGLAGVFISAQTGSADPLIGNPMLLQMFAAVVVGGTKLGGGRGGPFGTVFGAYILMMVVNILLVLNVSAYYSTVAEGIDPDPRRARRRSASGLSTRAATSRHVALRDGRPRPRPPCFPAPRRGPLSAAAGAREAAAAVGDRTAQRSGQQRRGAALRAALVCLLRPRRRGDASHARPCPDELVLL